MHPQTREERIASARREHERCIDHEMQVLEVARQKWLDAQRTHRTRIDRALDRYNGKLAEIWGVA